MPPAVIGAIITAGAQVGSSAINSRAQGQAADKQAEAIEKGIDLQKQMYEQDRADFAPYRALGGGAVSNLAYLSGINLPAESSTPKNPNAVEPMPKITLSNLGAPSDAMYSKPLQTSINNVNYANEQVASGKFGPTIKVTKGGQTRIIPATLLPDALKYGYTQVQ